MQISIYWFLYDKNLHHESDKYFFWPRKCNCRSGGTVAQIGFSTCFLEHLSMVSFYVSKLKIFKTFCWLYEAFFRRNLESARMIAAIVWLLPMFAQLKRLCSRWYCFQFNKIENACVRVEILCLDNPKTLSNQYINREKWQPLKIVRFCNLYFSYVRDNKAR